MFCGQVSLAAYSKNTADSHVYCLDCFSAALGMDNMITTGTEWQLAALLGTSAFGVARGVTLYLKANHSSHHASNPNMGLRCEVLPRLWSTRGQMVQTRTVFVADKAPKESTKTSTQ